MHGSAGGLTSASDIIMSTYPNNYLITMGKTDGAMPGAKITFNPKNNILTVSNAVRPSY